MTLKAQREIAEGCLWKPNMDGEAFGRLLEAKPVLADALGQ